LTRSGERDLSRIGGIDYLLMTAGSCLAVFAGGMSIQDPSIVLFSVVAIALGAFTSFFIRGLYIGTPHIKLDGYLYSLAIVAAFAFGGPLEAIMPNGGYATDMLAAGWLTWMLIFGSFFTWQDNTLVFQAIPSVALLGLVGVYDTFRDIRFAFFGYLLCLATLFARAHRRSMLRQAADSGYFTRGLAPGTPSPSVETTPGLAKRMEDGPWKWTAGPGWALASAFAVVLISLLGTPVIQQSVQSVTGFVKVAVPKSAAAKSAPPAAIGSMSGGNVRVGRGPNSLRSNPVCEVQMDHAYYLRTSWLDLYAGGSWSSSISHVSAGESDQEESSVVDLAVMSGIKEVPFVIRLKQQLPLMPVPGSMLTGWINNLRPGTKMADGTWSVATGSVNSVFRGTALTHADGTPTDAIRDLPDIYGRTLTTEEIPEEVASLAKEVASSGKNDYEKAELIRQKIANTIVYNLGAEATPEGKDPVAYTLFEQKQAYCDIYASAMTLMARSIGIPARFCLGYRPDETERDPNGIYVVLESDLHAWSELYFKDYGWVVFDATDGAASVPGSERGSANDEGPLLQRPWVKTVLDFAAVLLLVGGIGFGVRAQLIRRRSITPKMELTAAYEVFVRTLERNLRVRRFPSQTPDEFLRQLKGKLGEAEPVALEINGRFVRAMYSNEGYTSSDVAKLRADVRNLSKMLRKSSPPR